MSRRVRSFMQGHDPSVSSAAPAGSASSSRSLSSRYENTNDMGAYYSWNQ